MKKYFYSALAFLSIFASKSAFAQSGTAAAINNSQESILGINDGDLRAGNVNIDSIPVLIATATEVIIAVAGTISIFMLIFYAVQMQLNSGITGDSTGVEKSKKGMIASGVGFVISISAWFVVARIIDLLNIAI